MIRFKCLLGVLLVGGACHVARAESGAADPVPAVESIPSPDSVAASATSMSALPHPSAKSNATGPADFAKTLLDIADYLCPPKPCPKKPEPCRAKLCDRDRKALLEHIKDTLSKLGALENAKDRNCVQGKLANELVGSGIKSEIAREVLALIASMPSQLPKKVKVTSTIEHDKGCGKNCPKKCVTTETSEVSAEEVSPAPLSTAVVDEIKNALDKFKCPPCCPRDCDPPAPCPAPVDPCQLASCFERRWELINMLIFDAEHKATMTAPEIAEELTRFLLNTKEADDRLADDMTRIANLKLTSAALQHVLDEHQTLLCSPCGVRILLRAIDGVGDIHDPFKSSPELSPWDAMISRGS